MDKKKRAAGFHTLPEDKMREVASLGGRTAHQVGRAHEWDRESARAAALRSVQVRAEKKRLSQGVQPPAESGSSTVT